MTNTATKAAEVTRATTKELRVHSWIKPLTKLVKLKGL